MQETIKCDKLKCAHTFYCRRPSSTWRRTAAETAASGDTQTASSVLRTVRLRECFATARKRYSPATAKCHRGSETPPATLQRRTTRMCDNYNLKLHKYVCITTYQPDTKSNHNPSPNPNPNYTNKQHAIMNTQLNIVAYPTYPDNFIRDMLHNLYYFRLESSDCRTTRPECNRCISVVF